MQEVMVDNKSAWSFIFTSFEPEKERLMQIINKKVNEILVEYNTEDIDEFGESFS